MKANPEFPFLKKEGERLGARKGYYTTEHENNTLDAHIKTFALQSIQQTQEAADVPKNVNYRSI